MKSLIIVGAGGHGLVVAEIAKLVKSWDKIYFADQKYQAEHYCNLYGIDILGTPEQIKDKRPEKFDVVVAVGNNVRRLELTNEYLDSGFLCPVVQHPQASVSTTAIIGPGTVIFAQSVINARAKIGKACIINSAAVIEHQCVLADGVHVSPNGCLAGQVNVGQTSWIGAGATVINNINIGANVVVGAGSVVVQDARQEQTIKGVPAK